MEGERRPVSDLDRERLERRRRLQAKRKRELERKKKQRILVVNMIITFFIVAAVGVLVLNLTSDKKSLRAEGIEYLNSGKYSKAEQSFLKALDEKQWFSEKIDNDIKLYLAQCYMYRAEFTEANAIYIELQATNTGNMDNNYILQLMKLSEALMKMDKGDYEFAYPVLKENIEAGNTSLNMYLATCYYKLEMYKEMIEAYNAYMDEYGVNTYVAYQLSSYYLSVNEYNEASKIISKGYEAKDDEYIMELKFSEIVYLEKTNQYDTAWVKVNDFLNEYPDNESAKKEKEFLDSRVNINTEPVHVVETTEAN